MYFWNIKKLNKDLSKGLEQKEDFKYLLVYLVVSLSLLFSSTEWGKYDMISSWIEFLFGVVMLFVLFRLNKWNNWKNFLSRYFSIWWVSFVRSLVFIVIPLIILMMVWIALIYWENIPEESGMDMVFFMVVYLLGYWYLNIKYWKELMRDIEK